MDHLRRLGAVAFGILVVVLVGYWALQLYFVGVEDWYVFIITDLLEAAFIVLLLLAGRWLILRAVHRDAAKSDASSD